MSKTLQFRNLQDPEAAQALQEIALLLSQLDGRIESAASESGVTSFNSRTGAVTPEQADYDGFFLTPTEGNAAYAALSHTHDDRYYTESEVDALLAGKANSSHTHDDRYYTESEITTLLAAKANDNAVVKLSGAQTVAGLKNFTTEIGARLGLNGDYSGTGGSSSWGANIWALDTSWQGPTASSTYAPSGNQYGLAWLRDSCSGVNSTSGEGLHIYRAGALAAAIGINGAFFTDNIVAEGDVSGNSDIRLKTDLRVIGNALAKVRCINGYTYIRKDAPKRRRVGVVSQEIQAILPEAVLEDARGIQSVAYGNLVALLIEAIKELDIKVNDLTV